MDGWLSIAEAAAMLGVSYSTVLRLIKKGKLPSESFGRTVRIPASAVVSRADKGAVALVNKTAKSEVRKVRKDLDSQLAHLEQLLKELRNEVPRV